LREYLFLTTADIGSVGRRGALDRLLETVEAFRGEQSAVDVRLALLLQRSSATEATELAARYDWLDVRAVDRRVSLSSARNILLSEVTDTMTGETVVAFPDDDAWYPPGTLARIAGAFASDTSLDLLFCRYGPEPSCAPSAAVVEPSLQEVISFASSNTIFVRGSVAAVVGKFDEQLGVGGAIMGGEDTEYALRAYYAARRTGYIDHPLVGHRAANKELTSKYYPGSLVAIARHAPRSVAGRISLARKIAVGIVHVASRRLALRDFLGQINRHLLADRRWLR
jgi:hypothetical protein